MKTIKEILLTLLVLFLPTIVRAQNLVEQTLTHRPIYFNRDAVWKSEPQQTITKTDTSGCPCDSEWSPIYQLTTNSSMYLRLAAQGDDIVHCIWMESNSALRIRQIKYARLMGAGKLIEPTRDIIQDSTLLRSGVDAINIVANDKKVYVFCVDGLSHTYYSPIWMMCSLDSGMHWQSPVAINIGKDSADNIRCVSISGDTLALLYTSKKLKDSFTVLYSLDGGNTWKQTKAKLPKGDEYRFAITPKYFHLLYVKYGKKSYSGGEVMYRNSKNFGRTWSKEFTLSTPDSHSSFSASIATNHSGSVYVTWLDGKYGSINGFGLSAIERHTSNNGKAWSAENVITQKPEASWPFAPYERQIDTDIKGGNPVAVTWFTDTAHIWNVSSYGHKIKTRINLPGNSGWCPQLTVTPDAEYAVYPMICVTSTQIVVGWEEPEQSTSSEFHYFIRSIPVKMKKRVGEIAHSEQTKPSFVQLEQNYPNPFNPTTVIRYLLPVNSIITLKVYNVLGQEVVTLVHDEHKEQGEQEVEFKALNIASGMYYYRLDVVTEEGERYSQTKKLMVIK